VRESRGDGTVEAMNAVLDPVSIASPSCGRQEFYRRDRYVEREPPKDLVNALHRWKVVWTAVIEYAMSKISSERLDFRNGCFVDHFFQACG
jgi:hypothetical protein